MQRFGEKALYAIIGEYLTPKEIIKNNLDIIFKNKQTYSPEDWICAAYLGRIDLIRWLYKNIYKYNETISCRVRFKKYHVSIVPEIPFTMNQIPTMIFEIASITENIKLLKFIHNNNEINKNRALSFAVYYEHCKIVKWLCKKGYEVTVGDLCNAVCSKNLKIIKLLCPHSNYKSRSIKPAMKIAKKKDFTDIFNFLKEKISSPKSTSQK
jgi:hypothetical protein